MDLAIAALAAYVLLVLNPEFVCWLAPGGHPGTTSVRLLYVSDYPGARPRAYWSRPRCSRCDRLIEDLSPTPTGAPGRAVSTANGGPFRALRWRSVDSPSSRVAERGPMARVGAERR